MAEEKKESKITFEKAMARLEQIVAQLEGGKCTLDDSLKLFEEGTKLTAYCSKALKTAEQRITRLTAADVTEHAPPEELPAADAVDAPVPDGEE